jgi:hypothetical protein
MRIAAFSALLWIIWLNSAIRSVPKYLKKELNSIIILVAWEIWVHHNECVFKGANRSMLISLTVDGK